MRMRGAVAMLGLSALYALPLQAQTLPGSADPGRIAPPVPQRETTPVRVPTLPEGITEAQVPEDARAVRVTLQGILFPGMTVFEATELEALSAPYLKREQSLAVLWQLAEQITARYREAGYFLSKAYVPPQTIEGGIARIEVVEGYIDQVSVARPLREEARVHQLIDRLKAQRPLTLHGLETFLLRLNDLPGARYRSVLEPILQGAEPGGVLLRLEHETEAGRGMVQLDNHGSRFLGPYQAMLHWQDSFLPYHETSLTLLGSLPADELRYIAARQRISVAPAWAVTFGADYAASEPGSSLAVNRIVNDSVGLDFGIEWQPLRLRSENLTLSLALTGKNTSGDILTSTPLTRDRIRALSAGLRYDKQDGWRGTNRIELQLSRGLELLGASEAGDLNLSRAQAQPDFTSLRFDYSRQQLLDRDWLAVGAVSGQIASGPLFSVEEFGYGGQRMGRAYDNSELTGDEGIAASLELQYRGLPPQGNVAFTPYGFYDIGKVWNRDIATPALSAASAGFGMKLAHRSGLTGDVGLAFPLTREADNPLYGDGRQPRLRLQLGYQF